MLVQVTNVPSRTYLASISIKQWPKQSAKIYIVCWYTLVSWVKKVSLKQCNIDFSYINSYSHLVEPNFTEWKWTIVALPMTQTSSQWLFTLSDSQPLNIWGRESFFHNFCEASSSLKLNKMGVIIVHNIGSEIHNTLQSICFKELHTVCIKWTINNS